MINRKLLLSLIILLTTLNTVTLTQAKTTTETVFDNSTIVQWGYIWVIEDKIPAGDTSVTVTVNSDESVEFWVADKGDADKYIDGYEIWVYFWEVDVLHDTFNFVLENKQTYEFVIENYNAGMFDAFVDLTISFTYETTYTWIIFVVIGILGVGSIVYFAVRSSKRKAATSATYHSDQIYQPAMSSDYTTQEISGPQGSALTKFCSHCGAIIESDAKFCTNCGSKYS